MVYVQHEPVKAEKLVLAAVGMLEQELIIPSLFTKVGIDEFKGARDDTVSVTVEGHLPFRTYEWRNDRSSPIQFDLYKERKISVTFGGNYYSAVMLTDEQVDMDFQSAVSLLRPQVKAVARGLGRTACDYLENAEYKVTIGECSGKMRAAIIEARRVLNAFNVPDGSRYMVVGTNWESEILNDESLVLAQNVGDANADSALRDATIGRLFGFTMIVDQTVDADTAYAFASSAFVFPTAAPSVPTSVPFGATTSFEGLALRWVRDYDPTYMVDRSVVNCYAGFRSVEDVLVGYNSAGKQEFASEEEYMVRGIRLHLTEESVYPATTGTTAQKELFTITGVGQTNKWPTATDATP